ncbi:hypothetical protein [Paenibacillus elgii]|uniref:hypothetical protein n=1 Tax=Paenibacillus elgii TaxID=189691 RepID=UPI0013CF6061|nr:hypothetical protein [Paenibacillus elgii]
MKSRKAFIFSLLAATSLMLSLQPADTYANSTPAPGNASKSLIGTSMQVDKIYVVKEQKFPKTLYPNVYEIPREYFYYDDTYSGMLQADNSYTSTDEYYIFTYRGYAYRTPKVN